MKTQLIIYLAFFLGGALNYPGQFLTSEFNTCKELKEIIFLRNKSSLNYIHSEKASYDQSIDSDGWIKRIKERKFGFPSFEKDIIEEINSKIEVQKKETGLQANELYHSITAEIVESFFAEVDLDYIVFQLKAAKKDRWDTTKYKLNFTDTITALKISEPYLSKDQKKAVVFIISPTLERAEFYRKIDGKWEYYFGSLLWIE